VNTTDQPGIRAAGAVLWQHDTSGQPLVALVHRPHHHDWSLPKGKVDPGETSPMTAVREIEEETGYRAQLGPFLQRVHYDVPTSAASGSTSKAVDYFSAFALTGWFHASSEVDELRWLQPDDAIELTSYSDDINVIESFLALPNETTTVLLVDAGDTSGNHHDGVGARPERNSSLSDTLCATVRAFAPKHVHHSPNSCWSAAVPHGRPEGAADDDPELTTETWLSKVGYAESRDHAMGRVDAITARGETSVVCAEPGVITDLVDSLAQGTNIEFPVTSECATVTDRPASPHASVWQLSLRSTLPAASTARRRPVLLRAAHFRM